MCLWRISSQNKKTKALKRKTLQNVAVLQQFLASKNEERKLEEIPPEELNEYLSEFIITVRTKDKQEEYEPSSLRGFIASFERYLKKENYGHSIIKDLQFEKTRKALSSKQKDLKRKGKGNKPNASVAISEDDIQTRSTKKPWFKQSPVGVNKLNSIMKVMSEKAELNKPRLKNHSGRKTMMQTLVNEEIPPTDIIQLSGHRNLQSVNNYATVSEKQQMKMSRDACIYHWNCF
ncbi:unnamed protein product [Porites lobata]|uniref:Tyr recombinase domain-containing protein n=1 Tax=Porites lobata TaxID=104759 RepID=A0ABN8NTD8_9CNID|nr:unnamed protein product [Porites lobata]